MGGGALSSSADKTAADLPEQEISCHCGTDSRDIQIRLLKFALSKLEHCGQNVDWHEF